MWSKKKNMIEELEINQSNIEIILSTLGADQILQANIRTNNKGNKILTLSSESRVVEVGEGSGLALIRQGQIRVLVERVADALRTNRENVSTTDLLDTPVFRQAVISEIASLGMLKANEFFQATFGIMPNNIPVFYGSTSGINFAEVIETAICSKDLQQRGLKSSVIFDYDSKSGLISDRIFVTSRLLLKSELQLQVDERRRIFGLANARLLAAQELLDRIPDLPDIQFVEGIEVFNRLSSQFSFTVGQVLLMSRIAGNDPDLFSGLDLLRREILIKKENIFKRFNPLMAVSMSVSEYMGNVLRPKGFTYYARDARICQFAGVVAIPLKLTDKANIYKILHPMGSLFDPNKNQGGILMPIMRQRIGGKSLDQPIDPIVLQILADNDPIGFERLVCSFREQCRVLSVDDAIRAGTRDNRFYVEDFFEGATNNG